MNAEEPANEDAELAAILQKSKEDYERTEILRKQQEEDDLQKAINESLKSVASTSSSVQDTSVIEVGNDSLDTLPSTSSATQEDTNEAEAKVDESIDETFHSAHEGSDNENSSMLPESSGLVSLYFSFYLFYYF